MILKVQSAWTKWEFENGTIYGGHFKQNLLYLFIEYSDGVYLNVLDFSPKLKEDNLDFLIHLDRKITFTGTSSSDGITTITLPYVPDNDVIVVDKEGLPVDFTISGVTLTLDGEFTKVTAGSPYTSSFTFPVFYYRTSSYSTKKVQEGLLMIKDVNLFYDETGFFEVTVTPNASSIYPSTYTFTGVSLGINSILDTVPISSGSFLFPVLYKNNEVTIQVKNSTYLPSTFLSVEWIGEYSRRGD